MAPGEIFVQRNVGNQAMHTDLNLMACLEYAVKSLKVGAGLVFAVLVFAVLAGVSCNVYSRRYAAPAAAVAAGFGTCRLANL
jgi:hypothetical protein